MATEVLLPKQGNTVESCILLEWKKAVGETVNSGEPIAEVETDKATFDVEATADGVLIAQLAAEGDDVPVLTPIAVIGMEGESYEGRDSTESSDTGAIATDSSAADNDESADTATGDLGAAAGVSPRARSLAAKLGVDTETITGSGPGGRIIERDVQAAADGRAPMTPAAREKAERLGAGASVPRSGSGVGGRIRTEDVRAADAQTDAGERVAAAAELSFPGPTEVIPVKGVRKVIAHRMQASLATTAQLTLNRTADARSLLAYRKQLKASEQGFGLSAININDMMLFAVGRVLPRFAELNAHFTGDSITRFQAVHLGFAVDTPRGLMVPVIRHASLLSLADLAAEAKRLAAACMEGSIAPDELDGATFTVTNLGALGIESFTPVLNPPQVGILGICSIEPKPTLVDGETAFVPSVGLSLTIDHQAVDGAPAARFLAAFADAVASFQLLLAR